ncbi:MAG: nucleoid-associated protein [Fidelibacterota bacterium]
MDILLSYTECKMNQVSVHHVGNQTKEEELVLSKENLDISDENLKTLLSTFFLTPFEGIEFYRFTFADGDLSLNPVCKYAATIFHDQSNFFSKSIDLAKYLYEVSTHPNIKSGDLFVAYFSNIHVGDQLTDAIGIFKSENKQSFLKLNREDGGFSVDCDNGISVEKLDKGCLIFNLEAEEGYKVCIVDKSNRSADARYWREDFLGLAPGNDNYNTTKEFLGITKNFITKQVPEEFEITRTDKIDLLNRSMDYFKTNEAFYKEDFETEVLQDENLIQSFRSYDETLQRERGREFGDHFCISDEAVKKQNRAFRSVIKLDKNFHIYVHGDKTKIEQGIDDDGRKYYKLYYENES